MDGGVRMTVEVCVCVCEHEITFFFISEGPEGGHRK